MKRIILPSLVMLMLAAPALMSLAVSAANNYDIEYSGGEPLGAQNVQIDPNLVDGLVSLMPVENITVEPSSSTRIQHGYIEDAGSCYPFNYVAVSNDALITQQDNISFTLMSDKYVSEVDVKNIVLDNMPDGKAVAVGMTTTQSYLWAGHPIYSDAECQDSLSTVAAMLPEQDERVFSELNIKVYKKNNLMTPFVVDGLYFGITDIDAAQSFKILNNRDILVKGNMYSLNAEGLQMQGAENVARNMYVEGGRYIYSENIVNGEYEPLRLPNTANLYVGLDATVQEEGLDIVFGFAMAAASGIEYYAPPEVLEPEPDADPDSEILVPNTGHYTGGTSAMLTVVSVFGIIPSALIIYFIPRLTRKKVGFKK